MSEPAASRTECGVDGTGETPSPRDRATFPCGHPTRLVATWVQVVPPPAVPVGAALRGRCPPLATRPQQGAGQRRAQSPKATGTGVAEKVWGRFPWTRQGPLPPR